MIKPDNMPLFSGEISCVRLSEISYDEIIRHMSDPRIAAHLPLLTDGWDHSSTAEFVTAKEACWDRDGLGLWAILCDGIYAGWGGFQKEGEEWDFGLVLTHRHFGLGARIVKQAIRFAGTDDRIPYITFLLPTSRKRLHGLARFGAEFVSEVDYHGVRFLKYRLDTSPAAARD